MATQLLSTCHSKRKLIPAGIPVGPHCSGFGVYGRNGKPNLLGQNNDLPPYYKGTHTVLNIKFPDNRSAIIFTWAGLLAQNGVNNKNVGVTMNIVPTAKAVLMASLCPIS